MSMGKKEKNCSEEKQEEKKQNRLNPIQHAVAIGICNRTVGCGIWDIKCEPCKQEVLKINLNSTAKQQ